MGNIICSLVEFGNVLQTAIEFESIPFQICALKAEGLEKDKKYLTMQKTHTDTAEFLKVCMVESLFPKIYHIHFSRKR